MDTYLTLKHLRLRVEKSELRGHISDDTDSGLSWGLDVKSEQFLLPTEPDDVPRQWKAGFSCESLPLKVKDWTALAHQQTSFDLATDEEHEDDSLPTLYVCSYLPLPKSHIVLGARTGNTFALDWQGLAEVNYDDDFGSDMPFAITGEVTFDGLTVRYNESSELPTEVEAAARQILRKHEVRGDNLIFGGFKRFRDEEDDPFYHLITASFKPVPDESASVSLS